MSSVTRRHRHKNDVLESTSFQFQFQTHAQGYRHSKNFTGTPKPPQPQKGHRYKFLLSLLDNRQKQNLLQLTIGFLLGLAYFMYVSRLFEFVTKFSHLSELERELSLPPDVAFRFTHFKRLAQSDTFFDGFVSTVTLNEDRERRNGNICSATKLPGVDAFRAHLLAPEVLQAGCFHLVRRIKRWKRRWRGWTTFTSKFSTCHSRHTDFFPYDEDDVAGESFSTTTLKASTNSKASSKSKTKEVEQVQMEKVDDVVDGDGESWEAEENCFGSEQEEQRQLGSSGSGGESLFSFYSKSIWALESLGLVILFQLGCKLTSGSIVGGGVSALIFLVIHPQRISSDWIFSFGNKIEAVTILVQMYVVSRTVLSTGGGGGHPSWTATVKVAVSTAAVILCSGSQAGHPFLISQLVIITCMEIFGFLSPYIASLVLFGQLTGWQYATMVLLDTSFDSYSQFLGVLFACIATLYVAQPLLERRLFELGVPKLVVVPALLVASQLCLYITNSIVDMAFSGNARYSGGCILGMGSNNSNNMIQIPSLNETSPVFHSGESSNSSSDFLFLSSLLCSDSCNYPTGSTYTGAWGSFLSKYTLHALTSIYVITAGLIAPLAYAYAYASPKTKTETEPMGTPSQFGSSKSKTDPSWSSKLVSSRGPESTFFISQTTPLITYHVLQLVAFVYLTVAGGSGNKTWELLFLSQLAGLCSLLCDRERITFVFGEFNVRKPLFSNGVALHWAMVLAIFLSLLIKTKHGSNEMVQNSRAKYEIGNKRMTDASQVMLWIQAHTDSSSCFVGLEIPLLYLQLATGRAHIFGNYYYNNLLDEVAASRKSPEGNVYAYAFSNVYRMFNRKTSPVEYYTKLKVLNASHLFLSRESCTQTKSPHSSELLSPSSSSPSSFHRHHDDNGGINDDDSLKGTRFSFLVSETARSINEDDQLGIHFKRSCDLSRVWDSIELEHSVTTSQDQPSISTESTTLTKRRARHQNHPRKKKDQQIHGGGVLNFNYDHDQDQDSDHERYTPDILCLRLMNDPDVRPFRRVFANDGYTILALSDSPKEASSKKKSKPKNSKRVQK